jgi:competence protein ComEA
MSREKNPDRNGAALLLLLAVVCLYGAGNRFTFQPRMPFPEKGGIFVEVAGAVSHPGVYAFSRGPDLDRLLKKTKDNVRSPLGAGSLNLPLSSGSRVEVQGNGDHARIRFGQMTAFYKITLGIPVSLNHENPEGLTALPGIGPRLAGAIVEARAARNGFSAVEDLLSVPGVSQQLFRKIRPYIKP